MAGIKLDRNLSRSDKFLAALAHLKVGKREFFYSLTHFWLWISDSHQDGILKDVSDFVIAQQSEWDGDPKAFVDALIEVGFIDREVGHLVVHDWEQWQPDWVRRRGRRMVDQCTVNVRSVTDTPLLVSSSKGVITYPTTGKTKTWELQEDMLLKLKDLYPGVDVLGECKKALFWVENNASKRKTEKGMAKFLSGWMERNQNSYKKPDKLEQSKQNLEKLREHNERADAIIAQARLRPRW